MLGIVTLLALLPLAALGTPASMEIIMETMYKPCIVYKRGCPPDGSMDIDKFESVVRNLLKFRPPSECSCDLSRETCVRGCYFAYISKMYISGAAADKTNPAEIVTAQKSMRDYLRMYIEPCVLDGKSCPPDMDYGSIKDKVRDYLRSYSLPSECDCDPDREGCIRQCYFAYLKRTIAASSSRK